MPKRDLDALSASPGAAGTPATQAQDAKVAALPDTKRCKFSTHSHARREIENNSGSALLNLPGELLNTIYEYVLTSDDDLLEYVPIEYANGLNASIDARSPDTESHIHTTELPSPKDGPDHPVPDVQRGGFEGVSDADYRKLKYVCKKFWRETYRLELQFNGVLLRDRDGTGVDHIDQFLAKCPPSQGEWLKRITILAITTVYGKEFEEMESDQDVSGRIAWLLLYATQSERLSKLEAFCSSYPWMSVRFVPDAFTLDEIVEDDGEVSRKFVSTAFSLYYVLRNTLPTGFDWLQPQFTRIDEAIGRDDHSPPLLQAPNLRVYPRNLLGGISIAELLGSFQAQTKHEMSQPFIMVAREWLMHGM
ncbi:hypothetical protein PSPO01_06628 [Paraphaeosphaeria sporulosa]